jgi:hypothetical protein
MHYGTSVLRRHPWPRQILWRRLITGQDRMSAVRQAGCQAQDCSNFPVSSAGRTGHMAAVWCACSRTTACSALEVRRCCALQAGTLSGVFRTCSAVRRLTVRNPARVLQTRLLPVSISACARHQKASVQAHFLVWPTPIAQGPLASGAESLQSVRKNSAAYQNIGRLTSETLAP